MDNPEEDGGSEKTPAGGKERTSVWRVLSLSLVAVMAFLIATFELGQWVGRRNSNWESRSVVYKFMKTQHTARFIVAAGRQPLPASDPIELRLRAGYREFTYNTDTDQISEGEAQPSGDLQALLRNQTKDDQRDQRDLIHIAESLGLTGTGLFSKVQIPVESLANVRNGEILGVVTAVTAVGASAALGYSLAYKKEPDYYSKTFQEMLHNKVVWQALARERRSVETSRALRRAAPSTTP